MDAIASRLDVQRSAAGGVDTEAVHAHLTADCVRRHGVSIPEPPPLPVDPGIVPQVSEFDLWLNRGQPLGRGTALSDPQNLQRQRNYLRETAEFVVPAYPAGSTKYVEGDPPQLLELPLPGGHGGSAIVPIGGCHGEASARLYGVPAETFERTRLALPRFDTVINETISDGHVDDRIDDYETCMESQGLQARTPADVLDIIDPVYAGVLEGTEQPARLARLEQRAVAADRKCKENSGLGDAFAEAFTEKGRAALTDAEGVVVEFAEMMKHARSVAKQLSS